MHWITRPCPLIGAEGIVHVERAGGGPLSGAYDRGETALRVAFLRV